MFAANKTEVAPLREDLTEVNKERNERVQIVIQAAKKKNWELAPVDLAVLCNRLCPHVAGTQETIVEWRHEPYALSVFVIGDDMKSLTDTTHFEGSDMFYKFNFDPSSGNARLFPTDEDWV